MEQLSHSTFVADTAKPSQESPSNPSLIIATDSTASHSAPCTSESISSSRPKPNVDTSKPTSIEPAAPSCKLACVMVGLPARGKTYIARKVARYLTWLGHRSRLFNVGAYRRDAIGVAQPSSFFDPSNEGHSRKRMELAMVALDDMLNWLDDDTTSDGVESGSLNFQQHYDIQAARKASSNKETKKSSSVVQTPKPDGPVLAQATGEFACVAMYDATNSTIERRSLIAQRCRERGVDVMFVESICEDEQLIMANIREVKISSPDYKDTDPKKAIEDFQHRIKFYEQTYETLHPSELDNRIAFAKLINVGNQVIVNRIRGYIHSRIVYFLMNLNTTPRSFYFSRHGESMFNVSQRIGGDSDLSWRGAQFAKKLPDIIQQNLGKETQLTIWTSTLRRTQQTAQHLNFPKVQWKQLDEIDSGLCDGLTYAEIELKYPADFAERDTDKFNYRYHGGESYRDLVHRLEPVILELERHHEPNHSILIIGHQAVLRCVYAYFLNIPHEELPYIKVPLHTVVKLTPKAYGCEEERFALDIAAVDTHRERPARSTIGTTPGSDKSHGEMPPTSR
ncbi:Fructose-2,6-bisphosphatase [Batrachochytrium dendrobatidis]|nr:Fructose-2,6-bisphosphatase [Batrachochytrium dendrobatidis]